MSTLEKPISPQTDTGQIPAEQAGIFLETIPIYPYELVHSAVLRINTLIRRYSQVSQIVHPDYKKIDVYVEQ